MRRLVLIRGLPGSGKSTMAKVLKLVGYKHFEADMFFDSTEGYVFNRDKLKDAHAWCLASATMALFDGHDVVVSNTFTQRWEMEPYLKLSGSPSIIVADGNFGSIHGVPPEAIGLMRARWED
jgi:predicted kinase